MYGSIYVSAGGVGGSLVGQVPYGVLVFGSYEMYKKELRTRYPETRQGFIFAAASLLGDLTGSVWLCPSEVIKQKMQAGIFATEREALTSIWKNHGLFGLYEGYLGGVARDVPFRVAQLVSGCHDKLSWRQCERLSANRQNK